MDLFFDGNIGNGRAGEQQGKYGKYIMFFTRKCTMITNNLIAGWSSVR